ncbi:centrosomin isoform X2 [Drosophila innubila]|uniref:centrosomin isoform X2 n=1 Tax=Drosophila innubila TaxID=198719 RepID=UPI00148E63C9|nr:centrosomin isoform X2 [Drosophila innubila]
MAGIFRSTSLNNSNNSPRTPHKRYSICSGAGSTFCTSPGGLQDVTMENSYTSFDAGRAPGGIHSPMQGRSMRELEEQMSTLRKENFNLKLRIYFMEESQQGARGKNADESLSKQLIDAKIEIEILRKRVDEKTELLKDAARAITQHEEVQKKSDIESQTMIEQMQQYIHQLESNAKQRATRRSLDALSAEKLKSLEAEVLKLENELREADLRQSETSRQLEIMENTLTDRQETLVACEAKIEELAIKNAELVEQLEREAEADAVASTQPELRTQLADQICELQDAQEKLAERERVHEKACRTIQKLMQKVNSQEKELKRIKQTQSNDEAKATTSPASPRHSLSDTETKDISPSLKQRYEHQITEQNEIIEKLKAEVKKKTANLQNLVNRELWEKNREVERLTKLVSNQNSVEHSGDDSATGGDLQQSFTEADYVKAVKRNKLLQRKVDVLLHRLNEVQQNGALITQLRHDLHAMQSDVESANKWRLECADVCSVLTNRLEELAGFLNSLLKHKDVLGVLAADRRHAMRRAIDRSLDLSKSLNMTLSITGVSLADQSLAQLSKLSEILYTEQDAECNNTYNSHEEIHAAANANAATAASRTSLVKMENKALKSDGQLRKERRSLPLPQTQLDNQSESEAWSEPDRKVSLARIGLEDTSNSFVCGEQHHSESDSEGLACSANSLKQERGRSNERITQLESLIAQRDERILHAQCQLVDADNRLKQEQLQVIELSQQLEQLRTQNEALIADLQAIGTQDDNEIAELQRLIELKTQQIQQQQLAHNTLLADAQITEIELKEAQKKIQEMEEQYTVNLDEAHAELKQVKLEATQRLEEQARLQQEALARDWVALTKHEEVRAQLLELQRSLEFYQESEKELKQTLVENELAARSLKKEVDESTLQASKAIMERTKAYNDKLQLEKRLDEMKVQLTVLQDEQRQQQLQQQKYSQPIRINSSDVSQSGYTSEEVPLKMANNRGNAPTGSAACGRINNPSPDLGIESDVGRVMSVELSNAQRTLLKTVELTGQKSNQNADNVGTKDDTSPDTEAAASSSTGQTKIHDCDKVEQEMAELRRKLIRTKRAFEDTYEKLRDVNKAKAQVEKDIKNQILKTHTVLRNVRSNMENVL